MGSWGAKLYQDDVALDVRDAFKDRLRRGKTTEEVTKELKEKHSYALDDIDDGPAFWLALADTQWNLGRLLPEVKEQAFRWLDTGWGLERWLETDKKLVAERQKVLADLREKLSSPQPEEKKVKQYNLYTCQWQLGDVFSYQLESDLAKEKGLCGRHFVIQKVDEGIWHPGHIIPIVRVKLTSDERLPTTVEEFNELEYVQIHLNNFTERFKQVDLERRKEDIAEKPIPKYEVDEFGYLPHYQIKLISTSKRIIPKKLTYLGTFVGAVPPVNEFVPYEKISISTVSWKDFESKLIERYCGYNKRGFSVYQTDSS